MKAEKEKFVKFQCITLKYLKCSQMFSKSSLQGALEMRTKGQQKFNPLARSLTMLTEIKSVLSRTQHTLIQDSLGAASLVVMLLVGLHLPGLI